jgi:protein SCO1/2
MHPRVAAALALLCAFGLVLAVLALRAGGGNGDAATVRSAFEGSLMPQGVRAPDFDLTDQDGSPITMRQFRGRPVAVTFLYTTCRETCPTTAQTIRGALDDLGHDVPAVAIAVNPPTDTAVRARAFLSEQRLLGRMDFVLGSRAELRPVWRRYAIRPQSAREEHQAIIILVDKRGFERVSFPVDQATPERLAHDLRLLEREPA